MVKGLLGDVGLLGYRAFYGDRLFILALIAGGIVWLFCGLFFPWFFPQASRDLNTQIIVSLVIWQPILEELLFRGVIQGQLRLRGWGREKVWGITRANLLASLLFGLAHVFYHPPLWALSVFVPSIIFGFFRDRYGSIYPSLALHVYYNAGYFLFGVFRAA